MKQDKPRYFTTAEFAKLCKVNKQTLIYYDNIGLLSPMIKNAKGYRYYSIHQLELFNVIDLFKDLGMSLNEIQEYTKKKSPELFLSLMYRQKAEVTKRREAAERNERILETKIALLEQASNLNFNEITLEYFPESKLYLSRDIKDITEDNFVEVVSDFIDELFLNQLDTGYPIGGITMREQVLNGEFTNYMYLYMEQPHPKGGYPFFETVKGDFLIGYHIGEERTIDCTYNRLFDEMVRLKLSLGKYVFEEYIYDTVVKNREGDYVTKIKLHVVR
ncbi:MerR family transcriptional regulator [Paenibacillus pseudetheri]|uniref:HTH merR-type domain-containing protein n=1 Tax=Paenibacillus pseudetheri TaxID=2897682 RepID=A0ABM9BM00_9BACL|nr:MerR family transcriptional regulator [Paenibacillus pseudetheri]CAH1059753.1 hypothetical protein PAECIP111894_05965 [Paenibacillus pseudetheri]